MQTAEEIFEEWLRWRSDAPRDPLTPAAARPYRYVWRSWCRWLTTAWQDADGREHPARAPSWAAAGAADVQAFLAHGPSPASGRKPRTAAVSEITRRRYWRVLDAVYQFACQRGLIEHSPAALMRQDRPPPESSEGLVFNPVQWRTLQQALPAGNSAWAVRDRAILRLLMDAALTTQEVCALQLHQVGDHLAQVALQLDGPRAAQQRTLVLGTAAGAELRRWMAHRRQLHPSERVQGQPVFVSTKRLALSPRTVFYLVSTTVAQAFGADLPQHIGPQVLRNSRLVMWLNEGVPIAEVVRRAGFKDAKSFRGLRRFVDARVLTPVRPRAKEPA